MQLRFLTLIDEYSRECLAIDGAHSLMAEDTLERVQELLPRRGIPEYTRSNNGSEFNTHRVRAWFGGIGIKTMYTEPGSPWENWPIESFNGKLWDEFLNRELLDTVFEAKVLTTRGRQEYNAVRPHSS